MSETIATGAVRAGHPTDRIVPSPDLAPPHPSSGPHPRTGATGFIGLTRDPVAGRPGRRGGRAVRPLGPRTAGADLPINPLGADVCDRHAVRRAMRGVERVFHLAGTTNLRLNRAQTFALNLEGTRIVLEEALRAGVDPPDLHVVGRRVGPAPEGDTSDESSVGTRAATTSRTSTPSTRPRSSRLRLLARGPAGRDRQPCPCARGRRPGPSSTVLVKRFMRREIPAYVNGTLNIVGVHDVARGHLLADERGQVGERYILGNRNFTLDRLFADLGRLSGVEPPAVKLPVQVALALATAAEHAPGPPMPTPGRDPCGLAELGICQQQGAPRAGGGGRRRTRTRSRRRSPGIASTTAQRLRAPDRAAAGAAGRRRRASRRGSPDGDRCIAARRRPTGCARVGRWRARCAATACPSRRSGCRSGGRAAPRSRRSPTSGASRCS